MLTPASMATSSRLSPGTRLVPPKAGSPACAGVILDRRLVRKSRMSLLFMVLRYGGPYLP